MFENHDNVIINKLEKLKNIVEGIDINILSETISNAINFRSSKYIKPSASIIKEYFKTSKKVVL